MAPKNVEEKKSKKSGYNKGAWTAMEDEKLLRYTQIHGAKRWKTLAINAGLNRCAKSCRLRWFNYLKPDIKRGNISEDEEELIVRLHNLLGNRWTLIAGRLPGRTDNEIKNYWKTCLSKKVNKQKVGLTVANTPISVRETDEKLQEEITPTKETTQRELVATGGDEARSDNDIVPVFDVNEFFDFSFERVFGSEWINYFFQ